MNYETLKDAIEQIAEDGLSSEQLDWFITQAEQKIYTAVEFPSLRRNVTGSTAPSSEYLSQPLDFLYPLSAAVIDEDGKYHYMLFKDVSFMREAFPDPSATGIPRFYATFSDSAFVIAPTPDQMYEVQLHYGYMPPSITEVGETWLGDNFDTALLNGALVEVARFMKEEKDVIQNYQKMYLQAIKLLKTLSEGRMRQDIYRGGQPVGARE